MCKYKHMYIVHAFVFNEYVCVFEFVIIGDIEIDAVRNDGGLRWVDGFNMYKNILWCFVFGEEEV